MWWIWETRKGVVTTVDEGLDVETEETDCRERSEWHENVCVGTVTRQVTAIGEWTTGAIMDMVRSRS